MECITKSNPKVRQEGDPGLFLHVWLIGKYLLLNRHFLGNEAILPDEKVIERKGLPSDKFSIETYRESAPKICFFGPFSPFF